MVDDLLEPERAIVRRLRSKIKTAPVLRAADLRDILQNNAPQTTPAIFVLFGGASASLSDTTTNIVLRFVLVVATRDVSDVRSGGGARDAAGPLASKTIEVMQGWRPCKDFTHLALAEIDAPLLLDGYFLLPLLFTTNTFVSGDNQYG